MSRKGASATGMPETLSGVSRNVPKMPDRRRAPKRHAPSRQCLLHSPQYPGTRQHTHSLCLLCEHNCFVFIPRGPRLILGAEGQNNGLLHLTVIQPGSQVTGSKHTVTVKLLSWCGARTRSIGLCSQSPRRTVPLLLGPCRSLLWAATQQLLKHLFSGSTGDLSSEDRPAAA